MTHETLTGDAFEDRFRPQLDPSGDGLREFYMPQDADAIRDADRRRCLWTAVDASDGPEPVVLMSGFHYVNRLYYIIAERPYGPDEEFTVSDELPYVPWGTAPGKEAPGA